MVKKQIKTKSKPVSKEIAGKTKRAASGTAKVSSAKPRNRIVAESKDGSAKYVVRGTVTHPDKSPAVGFKVIAFDKDVSGDDRLGEALTDASGSYRIQYGDASFRRSPKESRGADIFIRILSDISEQVFESKTKRNAPVEFVLDVQLPAKTFLVRGQVRSADGTPVPGAQVRVYDKDLRRRETLGASELISADKNGSFEVVYTAEQFTRAEKNGADLLVEARQDDKAEWSAAPIRFNAQPVEVVDVTLNAVYRGPSEFRRLVDGIAPLLDGLTMAQLTESAEFQDISFLGNELDVDRQLVAQLALSALRAQEEDLLRHEEYYGLFRQNLPTDLDALLEQQTDALRGALEVSARDNIVGAMSGQDLDGFVVRVLQLKADRALGPGAEDGSASLGDLLAVAVDAGKRERIAKHFAEHEGASDAFWKALEEDRGVGADEVKAVRQTLALGNLTGGHLPLVRALYQMGKDKAAFTDLRGFAQFDEAEWQAVLRAPQEPGDSTSPPIGFPAGQESIESYARTLNGFIEHAFPMAVIANRLERDISDNGPFKEAKDDLLRFFSNNPVFSFADAPPDLYLSDGAGEKLRDVKNPGALREQLRGMRRVFNLAPRFPEMRALLADDLDSATAMVHAGKRRFTEKHGETLGGPDGAREVFERAEHIHATALSFVLKHAAASNSPLPCDRPSGGEVGRGAPGIDRQIGIARGAGLFHLVRFARTV